MIKNATFVRAQLRLEQLYNTVVGMENVKRLAVNLHAQRQNANAIQDGQEINAKYQVDITNMISLILMKDIILFW